jgi:RHS repeat-associated protein
VRSLLTDHQGSISSIVTDSTGASLVGESFTAYGNRREASTWSGAPASGELTTMNGVSREGYTFQAVLGSMGLNHMNGRIEDSVTGRFLSADPRTPSRYNTQSWNRYTYVNNNPLSFTDPSGFVPWKRCTDDCGKGGRGKWSDNDPGALSPYAGYISPIADGMIVPTGSTGGPSIGSVNYIGDNGGPGIGGIPTTGYDSNATRNAGASDEDLSEIELGRDAVKWDENGKPAQGTTIGSLPYSNPNAVTQHQIDDSKTANEQYESDLQNERALRDQGNTDEADKFEQRVLIDIDRLIADQTPGSTGPSGIIWNTPANPVSGSPVGPSTPGGRLQPPPIIFFPPN